MMRVVLVGIFALMGAVFGVWGYSYFSGNDLSGPATTRVYGAPFTLVDQKNKPITEAAFRGQPSAVFFGFTNCPEVCPTTLFNMDDWLKQLGDDGKKIRAYLVTTDPERDTPEVLDNYISNVTDRVTGITGKPEDVAAMAKSFGIYAKKVPLEDGGYTMDHTASVLLLGPTGDFEGTIAYEENRDAAIAKLKRLASPS
ncbi:MAG: SCO family protein [Methylobacterium mesophilicum]|nr:SCO family protein [Methylobacterium mesophilicum]